MYIVQLYTYQLQDRYMRSLYRRPVQIPKNIQDLTIHRPHRCYGSNGHHFISRLHKYILKLFFIAVPKERQKSVFDSSSLQRYNFSRFFFFFYKQNLFSNFHHALKSIPIIVLNVIKSKYRVCFILLRHSNTQIHKTNTRILCSLLQKLSKQIGRSLAACCTFRAQNRPQVSEL